MFKLILKDVNKQYGNKKVLENLNISIKDGERISILGPSGCGKSTMLGIMAGLVSDYSGKIFLGEKEITNTASNKRNIVIVNQENLLFPHMNVFDNIAFGLKVRKKDKTYIKEKVEGLLKEIGLEGYNEKKVNKLSGGEKQRVALARALAVEPEVLLLDEAYSSLDTNLRDKMRELTIRLQKKHNITTVLVTHDKEEAIRFSNRVAVMLNGKIRQFDSPENVYESPIDIKVARFMADDNFIESNDKTLFIKVEDIEISADRKEEKNIIGTVKKCEYSGARNIYEIEISKKDIFEYIGIKIDNSGKSTIKVESEKDKVYKLNSKVYLKIKKCKLY